MARIDGRDAAGRLPLLYLAVTLLQLQDRRVDRRVHRDRFTLPVDPGHPHRSAQQVGA